MSDPTEYEMDLNLPNDVPLRRIPGVLDQDPIENFWYELEKLCVESNKDAPPGEPRFDISNVEAAAARGCVELKLTVVPIEIGDEGLMGLYRSLDRLRRAIMLKEMGVNSDDMVDGSACSSCGVFFVQEHGYPVLCKDCYQHERRQNRGRRPGLQKAVHEEA